jgi:glutamine cyclotransferase
MRFVWVLALAILSPAQFVRPSAPVRYGYKVVKAYPHDAGAFTQGLEYRDGMLFEGTGLNGRSSLRRVRLSDGKVLASVPLSAEYFGEGITVQKERILQLTWKHGMGFLYDRATLKKTGSFAYPGEGWGLANDGKFVYMSDGSSTIRVWDPVSLKEVRRFTVKAQGRPVGQLNELEMVEGELYANVWQNDVILRIAPADGTVVGVIDLTGILGPVDGEVDVLNGIAYDAAAKRLFVTGKLWPKIFEIQLVRK